MDLRANRLASGVSHRPVISQSLAPTKKCFTHVRFHGQRNAVGLGVDQGFLASVGHCSGLHYRGPTLSRERD